MSEAVWIGDTVGEIMHGTIPLVSSSLRISEAIESMTAGQLGCVGVVDNAGHLMGVITDGDLRRHFDRLQRGGTTAADIMTWHPVTVSRHALLSEALMLMTTRKITALFVVEDAKPVGIVHIHDLVAAGA